MTAPDHPPGAGWHYWLDFSPYAAHLAQGTPIPSLIEVWRREQLHTEIINPVQMHPAMNVAGLYWRLPHEEKLATR